MQTTSTKFVSRTCKLVMNGLLCSLLIACNAKNDDPNVQADTAQKDTVELHEEIMDEENVVNEGELLDGNHEMDDGQTMSSDDHANMTMNMQDMNADEPPEALGQDYSIYQVGGDWVDQHGKSLSLEDLKGKNQVVVMAYTSCQHTCPILVRSMIHIDSQLTPEARAQTQYVLATLDTERDTPEVMNNYAEHNSLDDNWQLIRSDEASTRMLANTLNIKYKFADNGDINHSNVISVLDKEGRLVGQEIGISKSGVEPLIVYLNKNA